MTPWRMRTARARQNWMETKTKSRERVLGLGITYSWFFCQLYIRLYTLNYHNYYLHKFHYYYPLHSKINYYPLILTNFSTTTHPHPSISDSHSTPPHPSFSTPTHPLIFIPPFIHNRYFLYHHLSSTTPITIPYIPSFFISKHQHHPYSVGSRKYEWFGQRGGGGVKLKN